MLVTVTLLITHNSFNIKWLSTDKCEVTHVVKVERAVEKGEGGVEVIMDCKQCVCYKTCQLHLNKALN